MKAALTIATACLSAALVGLGYALAVAVGGDPAGSLAYVAGATCLTMAGRAALLGALDNSGREGDDYQR